MKKILTILGIAAASLAGAQAAVLLQDNFPTNGDLVGTTPTVGGVWQNVSGTAGSLDVVSNKLRINVSNTEDAESDFSSAQTSTIFAGFTINMSATNIPTTTGEYFASFRDGTGYDGRLFALRPTGTAAGKFRLGISNASSSSAVNWSTDLDTGVDYNIVLRLTIASGANDFTTLWVNPATISSTSISTSLEDLGTSSTAFAFRQAGAGAGNIAVDNLVVSTTFAEAIPEPSTWALIGLGSAFMMWNLRRKRRIEG